MKIWVHPYELTPLEPKLRPREGVLVKAEWVPGQFGFSDLHPWPEFGEPTIEEQIKDLTVLKMSPLIVHSLDFNYTDSQFRAKKRNAFLGLILPRAHKLVFNMETLTTEDLIAYAEQGFTHLKVKMGRHLEAETRFLNQAAESTKLLWRIDFNGRIPRARFVEWWMKLEPALKQRIDFIEDPIAEGELDFAGPWARDWRPLAKARVRVIKPARETTADCGQFERVVFTHSLEHIYGQACSLWSAARYYLAHPRRLEVCGLGQSEFLERGAFARAWSCPGPWLKPTPGTGFGFDDLLAGLKWDRLL